MAQSHKGASPQFVGKGMVYRLARRYQTLYKLSYTAALAKAKAELDIDVLPLTTAPPAP